MTVKKKSNVIKISEHRKRRISKEGNSGDSNASIEYKPDAYDDSGDIFHNPDKSSKGSSKKSASSKSSKHNLPKQEWTFKPRFRKGAFGWRSETPIKRIKEAVNEIKKVAKANPEAAAEGAVVFLERVSAAIENVDSSSGAIGNAVNKAIDELVAVIAQANVDNKLRGSWLERLWEAIQNESIPYIEQLAEHWGTLCKCNDLATEWADNFEPIVRACWQEDGQRRSGYFHGIPACLSCLYQAEHFERLFDLLELEPYNWLSHRQWGSLALAKQGKTWEAIDYTRECTDRFGSQMKLCEKILLEAGEREQAYSLYAIEANWCNTNLATFRALKKKYPEQEPAKILNDLVENSPGDEGKWFAAAKDAGCFDFAIQLVEKSPCDPLTLSRASRDYCETQPEFALCSGLAALKWFEAGYGYEISNYDVTDAYRNTLAAAVKANRENEIRAKLRDWWSKLPSYSFVRKSLDWIERQ
jgi:hypothetical protein